MAGHELADDRGRVIAEAELAWPAYRIAALLPDQEDLGAIWRQAGWQVVQVVGADGAAEWVSQVQQIVVKGMAP